MMNGKDADWPSLPPIRTSSYNARVSCETLNLHASPPGSYPHTTSNTPSSTSHPAKHASKSDPAKHASKSADASPLGTSSSSSASHFFSCFPHRFVKGHGHGHGHEGGKRGAFDTRSGLLRSMFGPVAPRYSTAFASGVSPPPSRGTPSSMSNSPSGRMKTSNSATSPINLMRSGGSTPHAGAHLRTSKGHAGNAFTMMPPAVVGKKKPPNYESDEPTSPEVTCIGKVRRKHCKATWDALVKEKDGKKKKKGKVKRLSGEMTRMSGEIVRKETDCEKKMEHGEPTFAAKLSKQRSERRRSRDFESFSTELDPFARRHGDSTVGGMYPDGYNSKAVMEPGNEDAPTDIRGGEGHETFSDDIHAHYWPPSQGECEHNEEPEISSHDETVVADAPPPSNCLLLMKKGSRNRSGHYAPDVKFGGEHAHTKNQWNWGQVST